ncbi:MAG TPA: hypothetical protein VK387_05600 [Thermoleophilaceae bacterium]|nr:hypothetical protein [Thermoleophilaceae bacterium]
MLSLPTGRKLLVLDAAVAVWALAWIAVGVVVGLSVAQLSELTGAFRAVGGAIGGVGDTLGSIQVPLLGGPLETASDAVSAAGRDVTARGDAVRADIERASVALGSVVALIPIVLVLLAYAPARVARARDTEALRKLVATGGTAPELESLLAERALRSLPYRRLQALAPRPWADDLVTRRALAEEELRRVGVRPPWRGAHDDRG